MDAQVLVRTARREAGLTLRSLAAAAGTSHSTLSAYETGAKTPSVTTLERILDAAGFAADVSLHRRHRHHDGIDRSAELVAALELAAMFPARHSEQLEAPVFPARRVTVAA